MNDRAFFMQTGRYAGDFCVRTQGVTPENHAVLYGDRNNFIGGAFGMSFELPPFLRQDVMDMAKKFVELEYSLDCLTTC